MAHVLNSLAGTIVALAAASVAIGRLLVLPVVRLARWLSRLRTDVNTQQKEMRELLVDYRRVAERIEGNDAVLIDAFVHLRRDVDRLYDLTGNIRRGPHE